MKRMMFLAFSLISLINASNPITIQNLKASNITPALKQELKNIFLDSFHSVYFKDWQSIAQEQENVFESYISEYKTNPTIVLFAAYKDNQLAGWALYKKQDQENAILEILCISPQFWRQGIGKHLVFSICNEYPTINHISLVTRDINPISPQFYEAQGFKKTDFRLPEYAHLENLLGFEWRRDN